MISRKYCRSGYGFILGCALTTAAMTLPSQSNAQAFARQPSIEIHLEALQALRNKQRAIYEAPVSNPNASIASEPLAAPTPLAEPVPTPAPHSPEMEELDRELKAWHPTEEQQAPVAPTPEPEPLPVPAPEPVPAAPSAALPPQQPIIDSNKPAIEAPKEEPVASAEPAFLAHEDVAKPKKAKKQKKSAPKEPAFLDHEEAPMPVTPTEQPAFLEHEAAPVPTQEAAPAIEETIQPLDLSDHNAKPAEPSSLIDTAPEPAVAPEKKSSFWGWVPFIGKKEAAQPSAPVNPLTAPAQQARTTAPEADNPMELPSVVDIPSSTSITPSEPMPEAFAPIAEPEPEPLPEPKVEAKKAEQKRTTIAPAPKKPEPVIQAEPAPAPPTATLPHEEELTEITLPEEKTEAPIPVVPIIEEEKPAIERAAPAELPEPEVKAEEKIETPVLPEVAPEKSREVITLPAKEEPKPAPVEIQKPDTAKAEKAEPVAEAAPAELPPPALPSDTDTEVSKEVKTTAEEEPQNITPAVEQPVEAKKEEPAKEEPAATSVATPLPLPIPPVAAPAAPLDLPNLPELPDVDAATKKAEPKTEEAKPEETPLSNKELAALPLSEPKVTATSGALATITFAPEEVDMPNSQTANLGAVITMLKDNPNKRIKIVSYGGNDRSGSLARRVALKRAIAVRKYFIEQGLSEIRINVQAMADAPANGTNLDRVDILLMDGGNS